MKRHPLLLPGIVLPCIAALAAFTAFFFLRTQPQAVPLASARTAPAAPAVAPVAIDWPARIGATAPAGFPALVRDILAQPPSVARDRALAALISAWIKRNPQGLRGFLDTLDADDSGLGSQFFAALSEALPYVSDEAASSPYLSELVSELVAARAEENPDIALAWAEKWLLGDALEEARVTVAGVLAEQSPSAALKQLEIIRNPLRRIQALSAISEGYAKNDPNAARKWAESLPHDAEVATAMNGVLLVMADQDVEAASKVFESVQARIAGTYARNLAANRRSRGLPEQPPLDAQGNPIVEDAGGEDSLPLESPDFDQMTDASETISQALALEDPAAALKWADSLPGVLKVRGKRAALTAWAETQPEQAYGYCVANQLRDPETYSNIFGSWAEADPHAAAGAATEVESNLLRSEAITSAVGVWAGSEKDLSVVGEWISMLPRESDRNAANRAFASAIDSDQPQLAWDRVMQISDPDDRREVLTSAFANMVLTQPMVAASALSRASGLTVEERRRLTAMLDPKLR